MSPLRPTDRRSAIDAVMEDPPRVHDGAPSGVWGTSVACYQFIADHLSEDGVTLETGLGISTVLLGSWAASHTCVVSTRGQVDALDTYTRERGLVSRTRFEVGDSTKVLPSLELPALDLFLIDGGHGFPVPVIDWYYGSATLKVGGIVVVDDANVPAVDAYLIRYLRADPRWGDVAGDHKWRAFRKEAEIPSHEEWPDQAFLGAPRQPGRTRLKSAVHRRLSGTRGVEPLRRRIGRAGGQGSAESER